MKKYILRIFLIYFILFFNKTKAQEDHLVPFNDLFSIYNYQFEYYSIVRNKLYENLSDSPQIRFLVMPSFSPENILEINESRNEEKYFIQYNIAESSIWYSKNKNEVKIISFKKEIKEEYVILLNRLFKKAILNTHYKTDNSYGIDGVNYYFMVWDFGIKGGKTWSPDVGTKIGELVEISNKLILFCKSDEIKFSDELLNRIKILTEKL